MIKHVVEVIHVPSDARVIELAMSIRETLESHGLHLAVEVELVPVSAAAGPELTLFFGSAEAAADAGCRSQLEQALGLQRLVVPIIDQSQIFEESVPKNLSGHNALILGGSAGHHDAARVVLEELGVEDSQRRVFISHKRTDALQMAEQLHDAVARRRFVPFIDRFDIGPGEQIQSRIADALEDFAFLLLIESPLAHESPWVFYEVDYAVSHYMGVVILRWPGDPVELPGTLGLPRIQLSDADLVTDHGYQILTDVALARVIEEIELHHAIGLVRRRKNLVTSVKEAALGAGRSVTALRNWRLLLSSDSADPALVGVAPRLPIPQDLHALDKAANALAGGDHKPESVLIHAARVLPTPRSELLEWCAAGRTISLVPANAVGMRWLE